MEGEGAARRGRPRSEAARRKVLTAARELLTERGLTGVTVEAIAARAGVGKPTIYRQWANGQAVAMDAFLEQTQPTADAAMDTRPLAALGWELRAIAEAFASPTGRSTAAMIAAAQNDSTLAKAFRNRFIMQTRERGKILLERAKASGDINSSCDLDVSLDLIYAPLYFRLLIGHGPLDAKFTDGLLQTALDGLRPR